MLCVGKVSEETIRALADVPEQNDVIIDAAELLNRQFFAH